MTNNSDLYVAFEKDKPVDPERLSIMQDLIRTDIINRKAESAVRADIARHADEATLAYDANEEIYAKEADHATKATTAASVSDNAASTPPLD